MSATLQQLAELVQGQVVGDPELVITAARPLNEVQAGEITFLENGKSLSHLHQCRASAAVTTPAVAANGLALIQVADPLAAFIAIVKHLHGRPEDPPRGVDPRACVHPSARIGLGASVFPLAVIGEGTVIGARCRIHSGVVIGRHCRLGDDVTLYPHVVLYDDTVLGNRVTIHANAVLGADGFGYRFQQGRHVKVPQLGRVEVSDDVEIGACTTIDRGTFGPTRIGAGTKIDNLVQVAHNCQIGQHNLLVGQVGIAGSSTTGDYVVAAGQVGISDHIHIGTGAIIGAKAGVFKNVPPGQGMWGIPAIAVAEQKRQVVALRKLPQLHRDLQRIKRHLGLKNEEQ